MPSTQSSTLHLVSCYSFCHVLLQLLHIPCQSWQITYRVMFKSCVSMHVSKFTILVHIVLNHEWSWSAKRDQSVFFVGHQVVFPNKEETYRYPLFHQWFELIFLHKIKYKILEIRQSQKIENKKISNKHRKLDNDKNII